MFTVRDAENAMRTFTILAIAIVICVFSHALLINRSSIVGSLYFLFSNVSNVLSGSTLLTILEEGISLMFYRIREALREDRQFKEEVYKQARQEYYREVSEWNTRRIKAETRGETFTEPMPGSDLPKRKKRRFLFFLS